MSSFLYLQPLEKLIGAETDVCARDAGLAIANATRNQAIVEYLQKQDTRLVITFCESCSHCTQQLGPFHRATTELAHASGLQSLLIIVQGSLDGLRINNTVSEGCDQTYKSACLINDTSKPTWEDQIYSSSRSCSETVSLYHKISMLTDEATILFHFIIEKLAVCRTSNL